MIDQLKTIDAFNTTPETFLTYENNITDKTNGTHSLKIEGVDRTNQDSAIAISNISFTPVFSEAIITSPISTNNLINNGDF